VDGKTAGNIESTATGDQCPSVMPLVPRPVSSDFRVFLATVPDDPHFAYGTGSLTHLWSVPLAWFRHDEMYDGRLPMCAAHYMRDPGGFFICKINATAHPNVAGANAFHKSFMDILNVAWKIPN
jgi:hypothetical protein